MRTSRKKGGCFGDVCYCKCGQVNKSFDRFLFSETRFDVRLTQLCHSNIGWFTNKEHSHSHMINDWSVDDKEGVYILWHKNEYCVEHDLFHMKGLYVGKGRIQKRIADHFFKKEFSDEMLIYFTYLELPNRISKYIEQLMLDTFRIPYNKNENTGKENLCAYFTQTEVD